jgi:xanthine/CO dehydrogenase XdhC/CoxF family maturation factor
MLSDVLHAHPIVRLDTGLNNLSAYAQAHSETDGPILATVVATAGSTYRKSGARMIVLRDGRHLGLLSGGCLEGDLQQHAEQVRSSGIPKTVAYEARGPDDALFGLGSGCEGAMRILLESTGSASPAASALAAAAADSEAGRASCLVVIHEGAGVARGTHIAAAPLPQLLISAAARVIESRCSSELAFETPDGIARSLIEYIAPPPHLLICGAGPDAEPLVAIVRALGWRITLVDHRPAYASARRFPGAAAHCIRPAALGDAVSLDGCHAAVVMSHHFASDQAYLRSLARSDAPGYIGLLGPKSRRSRLLQQLGSDSERLEPRLHSPVGLDLGAVTPEGIALAIASEIHAWLAGRQDGASLWQHEG